MKALLILLSVLAAASLSLLRLADRYPPPRSGSAELCAYASGPGSLVTGTSCRLDPNFEPVQHTARRQVQAIFRDLAYAAGTLPDAYSIELMRDRRGHRAINAMTCPDSRVIWISVTAWERLHGHQPALALLLAHELAHADHRHPTKLKYDRMTAAERELLKGQTARQTAEVAADQRAADLMVKAGYTAFQVNQAALYILARDENGTLALATPSHPSGRDRLNLLNFYLARAILP